MVRHRHRIALVGVFLIGWAVLLIVIGCAGTRSESPKGQGHTEATAEQARSPEATASEEARCEGTRTLKIPHLAEGVFTTNDLPGCPNKGGLLSGTDKYDSFSGEKGDDKIRGLGNSDMIYAGPGNDVIYGGPGDDLELLVGGDGQRDKLSCGKGRDSYTADKLDYVSSSCEKKLPPEEKVGDGENSGPSKLPPELREGVP